MAGVVDTREGEVAELADHAADVVFVGLEVGVARLAEVGGVLGSDVQTNGLAAAPYFMFSMEDSVIRLGWVYLQLHW